MSDTILTDVLRALNIAVLEYRQDGTFTALAAPPDWFDRVFAEGAYSIRGALTAPMPFLESFLPQAEGVWRMGVGVADSGPFTTTVLGEDFLVRAIARTITKKRVLVLERLSGSSDHRPVLQSARELALERELIVGKLGALRPAADAIDQAAGELLQAALPSEQQRLAERMRDAAARMKTTLAALPEAPQKTRPR